MTKPYLAVAISPPAGWRIEAGESGYYGFGWHTESGHEAGMNAAAECRGQGGGSVRSANASGTSLRGGCVGLAMARDLRSGCGGAAFGGKYEDTVVEHSCDVLRIMCAGDVVPATGTTPR